jgi:hypothetical protein
MTSKLFLNAMDIQENLPGICRPTVFPGTFSGGGSYTPFFAVNAPPGQNLAGLFVEVVSVQTCTATATATVTDPIYLSCAGYNVSDAPNADARCRTVSSSGVIEAERLLAAPMSAGIASFFKYPRTGVASTSATGTATYTTQFVIPCGEPTDAVQVQFKTPSLTAVYASGITVLTLSYTVYPIPSVSPATVAFVESPLPAYGASAVVPVEQYQPTNIAADLVDFVGATSATFQTLSAYDTTGNELVNLLTQTTIQAVQYGYPGVDASAAANIIVNTRGSRLSRFAANLSASATLEVLWIQVTGVPTAGPTEGHDTTPSPPATQKVGASQAGTIASVPARGGTGRPAFGRRGP